MIEDMERTIVIVGGSAGADIVTEIFNSQYKKILYLETYSKKVKKEDTIGEKIADSYDFLKNPQVDYFIATGDNRQREENYNLIFNQTKKNPVNCIHQSSYIAPSSNIGYGNLICPLSVIHTNAHIGNNTIINTGSIIEHDCVINDFVQISPNVTICGYVTIGKYSFIGAGSVLIPKIIIGENVIVAAGASVIEDIGHNKMYAGVPAKFKKDL